MNRARAGAWFKRNGLILILLAAIVAALALGPRGSETPMPPADESAPPTAEATRVVPDQNALRQALDAAEAAKRARRRPPPSGDEDPAMQEHLEKLETDLERDETAVRLCALGNLYQQKNQDYQTAAGYYELLIEQYSDWEGIGGAYHQLITCYKMLEDEVELRLLYRKIMETFPEESAEYQAAQQALEN